MYSFICIFKPYRDLDVSFQRGSDLAHTVSSAGTALPDHACRPSVAHDRRAQRPSGQKRREHAVASYSYKNIKRTRHNAPCPYSFHR